MDLQWLDDVLVLLEEGNMTRAASRRNITQPAFSRRIRGFEDWLGTKVLERGANSVDISAALSANEAEIRALIGRVRDLRSRIAHFDPASSTVSLSAQHASVISTFPDMAVYAKRHFPSVKFRLRPGNLGDCVTMFLRGDTSVLLCYESDNAGPLPFGSTIRRAIWGNDYLIPVVGGGLRYAVRDDGSLPVDAPAIVYPQNSYFGSVLTTAQRPFGTLTLSENPVCETAFSSGIRELVVNGMGVGWLPYSMAHKEIESGDLISLSNHFGREQLKIVLYADSRDQTATSLLDIWSVDKRQARPEVS
ncbi:LysR family transcriptional regulator [Roseobacter sp. YSTF-M11]|uniref:LysR family transcriptional regulator n=1 Tax=Roseobacter insulae TaxID=2859783 RepID=A0A9X1G0S2_9RHOB|nr:LysR family transcriptional regulator [Roseobacter insulae]MBW4710423.1 LysR family transcriptional regulator [Roseobacter insulae]